MVGEKAREAVRDTVRETVGDVTQGGRRERRLDCLTPSTSLNPLPRPVAIGVTHIRGLGRGGLVGVQDAVQ